MKNIQGYREADAVAGANYACLKAAILVLLLVARLMLRPVLLAGWDGEQR